MIRAVISIGTNSTRALAAHLGGGEPRVVLTRSTGTRIGEGLRETGKLQPKAVQRTLEAVREHAAAVRALTPDICTIATSALRRAQNGAEFAAQVQDIAGVPLEIISGEEEARRSYIGAVSAIAQDGPYGVLDTGGGSSEYAVGAGRGEADAAVSCEIGAVRLTQAFAVLSGERGSVRSSEIEEARSFARRALEPARSLAPVRTLLVTGGSATTTVRVLRGARDVFLYALLERADLQQVIERLAAADIEARRSTAGMNAQRADILLAGALILDEFFALTGHTSGWVTTNDLLLGTLLQARQ